MDEPFRYRPHLGKHSTEADAGDEARIARRVDRSARLARRLEGMRAVELAHDDLHGAARRTQSVGDAAGEPAAAERHEDRLDVRQVFEYFRRERAVSRECCRVADGID